MCRKCLIHKSLVRDTGFEPAGGSLKQALTKRDAQIDAQTFAGNELLAEVVRARPHLSEPLQAAILAIVRSVAE